MPTATGQTKTAHTRTKSTKHTATSRPTNRTKRPVPSHLSDWEQMLDTALSGDTDLAALTRTYARFYDYSLGNVILLAMQGVSSPVATFNKWKTLGYRVKKGSKAYFINRPVLFKDRDAEQNESAATTGLAASPATGSTPSTETPDAPTGFKIGGFKLVPCLFSADQVDPDPQVDDLDRRAFQMIADNPADNPITFDVWLERVLKAFDIIRTDFTSTNGNMQGYSVPGLREFAINPVAKYPVKTTLHELAHILMHAETPLDPKQKQKQKPAPVTHQGIKEFQAEAVALITGRCLNLPDAALPVEQMHAYIQTWLTTVTDAEHNGKPTERDIRKVFDTCTKLLQAGKGTD